MTTIGFTGRQGWQRMKPANDAELGRLVRAATWEAVSRTSTLGASRDRQVLATVTARHPTAVDVFGAGAIVALLRQPAPGRCTWDALRVQDRPATPTDGLRALLGAMCGACKAHYQATERATELVADARERERAAAELCRGRPWLAAALAGSAHGPHSLRHQLDRDALRMGAWRAGEKWGINPRVFLGDRTALRQLARHPVWSRALTRGYDQ